MKITTVVAAAFITFMAPAASLAQNIVVPYDNLVSVLSGYHGIPGADYWERLHPESTRASLMRMADDESVFTIVRARAMQALAYYINDDVSDLLGRKAIGDKAAYIRSAAYRAIADAGGSGAVRQLGEALKDEDVMVRLTAVRSLRGIGTQEARKTLRSGLAAEKNSTARSVINKALQQMK